MLRRSNTSTGSSSATRESVHNRHSFTTAWDDLSCPYPTSQSVYAHSNLMDSAMDSFSNLFLSNFIIAHKRIARRKLDRLQSHPHQAALLQQGVQSQMDCREPYDAVVEASIGYTGACTTMVLDEDRKSVV